MGPQSRKFVKWVGGSLSICTVLSAVGLGFFQIPFSHWAGIKGDDVDNRAQAYFNAVGLTENAHKGHYFEVLHDGGKAIPKPVGYKEHHGDKHAWLGRYPDGSCLLEWQENLNGIFYVYQKQCQI